MNRWVMSVLLIGLCPTGAHSLPFHPSKSWDVVAASSEVTDIPMRMGIRPDLPYVTPGGRLGHWGVGNGGDWLRIGFARAREYAANIVLRIKPNSLSRLQNDAVRQWILNNQKFLAADILQTEHVWVQEAKPTCAFTVPPGIDAKIPTANPIEFSYPVCRLNADNFMKAAQILIHEATHHFNADETTADLIAIGIIDAWQSGMMDSTPLGLTDAPGSTQQHAAVWTGDRMLIVGGFQDESISYVKTASAYDPATQKWNDLGAPDWFAARGEATAIWTGSELFVWGGFQSNGSTTSWIFDGALYNPSTKVWTPVKKPDWWLPKSQTRVTDPWQTMVWTGNKAIIWGGIDSSNRPLGAIFDPATRSWTKINTAGYAPVTLMGQGSAWTGDSMIVWGGYNLSGGVSGSGAVYNLATDSWKAMDLTGAPAARAGHQVVWTGDRFVVISGGGIGTSTDITSTGGLYDPSTNTWSSFKSELMAERFGHHVVWNGQEILLIGGQSKRLKTYFGEVYALDPVTLRWRILPSTVTPPARSYASIVWTGSSALVWGGYAGNSKTQRSGAMYFP